MAQETPATLRKAQIDALLLKLPGAKAKSINGLDAHFVSDKMFACIGGRGVGLCVPIPVATELTFSRDNVVPFTPKGMSSTREWVQIDRADAADYENDLPLFESSIETDRRFIRANLNVEEPIGRIKRLFSVAPGCSARSLPHVRPGTATRSAGLNDRSRDIAANGGVGLTDPAKGRCRPLPNSDRCRYRDEAMAASFEAGREAGRQAA